MKSLLALIWIVSLMSCSTRSRYIAGHAYPMQIDRELRLSKEELGATLKQAHSLLQEGKIYTGYDRSCFKEDSLAKTNYPVINYIEVPPDVVLALRVFRYSKNSDLESEFKLRSHSEFGLQNIQNIQSEGMGLMIDARSCWRVNSKGEEQYVISEREFLDEKSH